MKATHKETKTMMGLRTIELKPGQFVFGLSVASSDLKIPKTTIYRILERLKKEGNISVKPENKFSIITIINWDAYQDTQNQNGKQMENKRKTNGNIQEQKKLKNKDIKKNIKKKDFIKPYLGEFENVKLTPIEHQKLAVKFHGEHNNKIEDLSCYIESKGDKYKSHYSTILMWDRKNEKETKGKSGVLQPTTYAQAQDAERRQRAAWLLKETQNDNDEDGGEGIGKAIPLLPSD